MGESSVAVGDRKPRVRFAPAPTGFLHVGGARTALFNWLFARNTGGTMVLRIEDTDIERSRQEWVDGIQSTLQWLGLDWDEGPILQSSRSDRYAEALSALRSSGHAYETFETPEELEAMNERARADGRQPGYDGSGRDLTEAQRDAFRSEGRPATLRFRTPDEGQSTFQDLVRGEVTVDWSTVNDFVIARADGSPTFYLANAVDDADMNISHVIRGEDLLDSTHRVLAIRAALGIDGTPHYGHLPLLVGADRGKLSKRHGAVSLEDFRDRGYLPEALLNYLALLGWSPPDGNEQMSLHEIANLFSLDRVTHSPAFFDYQKLDWMNGEYIRAMSLDAFTERAFPYFTTAFPDAEESKIRSACALAQTRSVTFVDAVEQARFLFESELTIAEDSWERLEATEGIVPLLKAVEEHLSTCLWELSALDLRPLLEPLGLKPRKALPAIYTAIEGKHSGLPLFESILELGRERAVARIRAAAERLAR